MSFTHNKTVGLKWDKTQDKRNLQVTRGTLGKSHNDVIYIHTSTLSCGCQEKKKKLVERMGKRALWSTLDLLIFKYLNSFLLLGAIVTGLEISLRDIPALEQSSKKGSTQIRWLRRQNSSLLLLWTAAFKAFMPVKSSWNWKFFSIFRGLLFKQTTVK